ncbi:phage baseplate protein [Mergibacter septicus]|uniref:Phage baseplate protein n=1 Tax=Mergibacter septicus TaxID=221402 RepID=A0A8E3SBP8_9PAST|nr:GPW/gp25 family protein [Mergibacter septicus]AWX15241.1 phage baseplate protein [Mergibacter septicus]QDJ14495.1 phage baseplate protein [Mergibacter septicus]UTU48069.1 GPW/gp25 family protein [Mergibacter septicus]WMR96319.1 GPW/gp25 family protein [Mergibacter septicus]
MNTHTHLTTHWQLAPNNETQSIIQGIEDIHLCIANILNTIKGSDILRPDFGSDHFQYLDQPEDIAIPNIVREIVLALQTWEKRIQIENIRITGTAPHFYFMLEWVVTDDVSQQLYITEIKAS